MTPRKERGEFGSIEYLQFLCARGVGSGEDGDPLLSGLPATTVLAWHDDGRPLLTAPEQGRFIHNENVLGSVLLEKGGEHLRFPVRHDAVVHVVCFSLDLAVLEVMTGTKA